MRLRGNVGKAKACGQGETLNLLDKLQFVVIGFDLNLVFDKLKFVGHDVCRGNN
jgi:hypothetical protein